MPKSQQNQKKLSKTEVGLVRRVGQIDNPVLRHFIKKFSLNDGDSMILGVLLDLTDQMKTPIKTTYRSIADSAGLQIVEAYHSIQSLHRNRIIEYKPSGDYVHISFKEIDESIEEISLAYRNAKKIKLLEEQVAHINRRKYVPADDLFDIMYPMIGRLVAAKIAEALRLMVDYINERLESSLSWRMWLYRIESFRTKVPLAEIILRESLPYYIDEIFLIEKKTSLLLGHASRTGGENIDKDLVGGMMAAINDFIRTSFKAGKSGFSELHFEQSKIMIAESVYFYAALVVNGAPDIGFMEAVSELVSTVHVLYRRQLKNFNGSMAELAGIEKPLAEFIEKTNAPRAADSGNRPYQKLKIAGAIVLAALIGLTMWKGYSCYRDSRLESLIAERIETGLAPYTHDVEVDIDGDTAMVAGTVDSRATAEKISGIIRENGGLKTVENSAVITDYRSVLRLRDEMKALDVKLQMFQLVAVRQDLEKIVIQFPAGSARVDEAQRLQIRRIYEILSPYPAIHVDIVAFNDPTGGIEVNRRLAQGRMEAVSGSLKGMGINGDRLHIMDFSPNILESDPRFAEFRDRRGIMLFAKFED